MTANMVPKRCRADHQDNPEPSVQAASRALLKQRVVETLALASTIYSALQSVAKALIDWEPTVERAVLFSFS